MKTTDLTACVIDNGIFFSVAQQLAKHYKRVLYHVPMAQRGFPTIRDGAIGDGFDDVELASDFWEHYDEIDLFVFPDIQHSGLQLHLESMGKPVWGSRDGDSLEINRNLFLKALAKHDLDVPVHKQIVGLTALRQFLKPLSDKFVKISRWRRDLETFHWLNWDLCSHKLDELAIRFGPLQDKLPFLVFDPIDCDVEVGYDGYCIDGQWPSVSVYGVEHKDRAYIGTVRSYDDLPEQVREVNEAFAKEFERFRYRNFFSSEIRLAGDKAFFIDPTCRLGMPSGDAQLMLYDNLGDIIWSGANGDLADPETSKTFAVQALIEHHTDYEHWRTIQIPDDVYDNVRLLYPCKVDDETYAAAPTSEAGDTIGSVTALGDSIKEAINNLKEICSEIEQNNVTIHTECLVNVLEDIEESEKHGVEFTDQPVPEPTSVL